VKSTHGTCNCETQDQYDARLRREAVSEMVAFLKSSDAVTLAGKGGAYELIERRMSALANVRPEEDTK
jgi:hypothetical protein